MISGLLLKIATPVIHKHLTRFFNLSLQAGKLPPEWKEAKVIPLFKGGEKSDLNNYRPISIIPVVMKIMERAVHNQLHEYLLNNNFLSPNQSAFVRVIAPTLF